MKTTSTVLAALLLAAAAAGPAVGADADEGDPDAMMQAWIEASKPGEHHERLAAMAGQWNVRIRYWAAPGAEPEETRGMAKNELILGGRFLQQEYKGSFMGEPFLGLGLEGYDPGRGVYTSDWRDSMSLFVMRQEGTCDDEDCTSLTYEGTWVDPVSGETHTTKSRVQHKSTQTTVIEMWDQVGDGESWKTMEMIYTRA